MQDVSAYLLSSGLFSGSPFLGRLLCILLVLGLSAWLLARPSLQLRPYLFVMGRGF